VTVDGKEVKLEIVCPLLFVTNNIVGYWYVRVVCTIHKEAGQERFRTITSSFYRGSHGVMLAFDLSKAESFESLDRWYSEVEKYGTQHIVKMLVGVYTSFSNLKYSGTKSDLKRETEFDEADVHTVHILFLHSELRCWQKHGIYRNVFQRRLSGRKGL
jgi:GTPase SAR1 family protein